MKNGHYRETCGISGWDFSPLSCLGETRVRQTTKTDRLSYARHCVIVEICRCPKTVHGRANGAERHLPWR